MIIFYCVMALFALGLGIYKAFTGSADDAAAWIALGMCWTILMRLEDERGS